MINKIDTKKELNLNDPEGIRILEKHAEMAKRFSEKFIKARIFDEETLHRHITI